MRSATGRVALRTTAVVVGRGDRASPLRKAEGWTATRMSIVSASDVAPPMRVAACWRNTQQHGDELAVVARRRSVGLRDTDATPG